jgi:hypothetical protein
MRSKFFVIISGDLLLTLQGRINPPAKMSFLLLIECLRWDLGHRDCHLAAKF